MYDEKWLVQSIAIGENDVQDFKQTISSSEKIAKTIVAFSNHKGGRILIGVKDNGIISGTSVTEDAFMIQAAIERFCMDVLPIKPLVVNYQKKKVLIIEVAKNPDACALAYVSELSKWLAYTRSNDRTVMVGYLGYLLLKEKSKESSLTTFGDNEKKITSYLQNHHEALPNLNEIKKNLQLKRKEAIDSLLNLLILNVIKTNYETDEERYMLV